MPKATQKGDSVVLYCRGCKHGGIRHGSRNQKFMGVYYHNRKIHPYRTVTSNGLSLHLNAHSSCEQHYKDNNLIDSKDSADLSTSLVTFRIGDNMLTDPWFQNDHIVGCIGVDGKRISPAKIREIIEREIKYIDKKGGCLSISASKEMARLAAGGVKIPEYDLNLFEDCVAALEKGTPLEGKTREPTDWPNYESTNCCTDESTDKSSDEEEICVSGGDRVKSLADRIAAIENYLQNRSQAGTPSNLFRRHPIFSSMK